MKRQTLETRSRNPRDDNSGYWMITNYRDPNYLKLPRRVNHATAIYKNKIYLLGGYHKLNPYLDYESMPATLMSLDCYEYDCFTQTCVVRTKCRQLRNEDMIFRSKVGSLTNLTDLTNDMDSDDCYPKDLPLLRYGLRACAMNDKIYICGGISDYNRAKDSSSLVNFSDVFELDTKTWQYTNLTKMTPAELSREISQNEDLHLDISVESSLSGVRSSPGVRDGHSLVEISRLHAFVIFGGYAYTTEDLLNDLWLFDCSTNKWHILEVKHQYDNQARFDIYSFSNYLPFPRDFSDIQIVGDDLVMYGGRTYQYDPLHREWRDIYDENVWIVEGLFKFKTVEEVIRNAKNFEWKKAHAQKETTENGRIITQPSGSSPTPRRSQMSFIRNDDFYVIGGVDAEKKHHPDIWRFSLSERVWTCVKNLSSSTPDSRRRGSTLYIPGLDWLVMICGTRPASKEERNFMKRKKKESTDEDGECLMEVDDLNIFVFGDTLRNKALYTIMGDVLLRNYDVWDEIYIDLPQSLTPTHNDQFIELTLPGNKTVDFAERNTLADVIKTHNQIHCNNKIFARKSIEVSEIMKNNGLALFSEKFKFLTAANQRNEYEELHGKKGESTPVGSRAMKKWKATNG